MTETDRTRRAVLTAGVAAVATLAGCDGGSGHDSQPSEPGTTPPTEPTTTALAPTDGTERPALDLREANVTGVAVTNSGGQDYRFDVTLYHDDDGEDGYADWWQVETLAGTDSAAGTSCTLTRRPRSPGRGRLRSPATWPAWWSGATTGPTATAGRR